MKRSRGRGVEILKKRLYHLLQRKINKKRKYKKPSDIHVEINVGNM